MNNTESQTPINSFTLTELIDLAGEQRQGLMRECITASSDSQMQVFRFPCRIERLHNRQSAPKGRPPLSFNLHEFRLKKDSMFIFTPKNILQVNSQQYFKADVIAISPDFMRRINIDIKNMMPLFLKFVENPTLALTPEESRSMRGMIAQIERETRGPETHFSFDIVSGLIAATIYKVGDIMYHYLAEHPEEQNNSPQPCRRVFQAIHPPAGRTLPRRAQRRILRPPATASRPNTSPRSSSASADSRFGVDRQLCDSGGQNPAQILDDEHTGDRLLPELPEPVVLRQLLQAQHGHVALAVQGAELTRASIRRNTSGNTHPAEHAAAGHVAAGHVSTDARLTAHYPAVCTPACIRNPGRSTAPGFVVAKPRQKGYPTPKLSAVFFQRRLWIHRSPAGLLGLWSCTPQSSRSTANLMSKRRPSPVLNPSCL